jgi:hypothetical protein
MRPSSERSLRELRKDQLSSIAGDPWSATGLSFARVVLSPDDGTPEEMLSRESHHQLLRDVTV